MKKARNRILKFEAPSKEILTTDEIMKVFSGLVRLIQKSAEYNAEIRVKEQTNYFLEKLNKTTLELNKRTRQLEEVLKLNEELIKKCKD